MTEGPLDLDNIRRNLTENPLRLEAYSGDPPELLIYQFAVFSEPLPEELAEKDRVTEDDIPGYIEKRSFDFRATPASVDPIFDGDDGWLLNQNSGEPSISNAADLPDPSENPEEYNEAVEEIDLHDAHFDSQEAMEQKIQELAAQAQEQLREGENQ